MLPDPNGTHRTTMKRMLIIAWVAISMVGCNHQIREEAYYSRGIPNCRILCNYAKRSWEDIGHFPSAISQLYKAEGSDTDLIIFVSGKSFKRLGNKVQLLEQKPELIDYLTDYKLISDKRYFIVIERCDLWDSSDHLAYAYFDSEALDAEIVTGKTTSQDLA